MTQQEQKDWTDYRQALLDDFAKAAMQGIVEIRVLKFGRYQG